MLTIDQLKNYEVIKPSLDDVYVSHYFDAGATNNVLVDGTDTTTWYYRFTSDPVYENLHFKVALPRNLDNRGIKAIGIIDGTATLNFGSHPAYVSWKITGTKDGNHVVDATTINLPGTSETYYIDLSDVNLTGCDTLLFTCVYNSKNTTNNMYYGSITEIIGFYYDSPSAHTYKLYKKGTDGTPTLFMPEQTTIGSSLGHVDLQADLASLASKQYVTDTIDNLSRSILAGKVDSYEDLPHPSRLGEAYVCPELTSNGTPLVDEYAVWSGSTYDPERFDAYKATYSDGTNATSWHSRGGLPDQYYMTFKTRFNATRLLLRNRYPYPTGNYVYAPREFSIEAKDSMGDWVTIYAGVNPSADGGAEYEVDFNNSGYYHEYRLNVTSTYPGDASSVYLCLDLVQLSGHLTGATSEEQDVRVGTMYLVGTEGNLEEYIFTEDLKWERLGEIRQSDVDLSGYTNTEGFTDALTISSGVIDTNIGAMSTDIQSDLDTLEQSFSGAIDSLPIDGQFQDNVPAEWSSDLADTAVLFVIEPDTIPYTAPELRDGDGTPFVDEYAVSLESPYSSSSTAYRITYDTPGVYAEVVKINTGFHMTFRDKLCPNQVTLRNRTTSGASYGYNVTTFRVEAKDSHSNWIVLFEGQNPDTNYGVTNEIPINGTEFYNEFRFVPTDCTSGSSGKLPHIDLIRLSGVIKKP